jgi:hypothetical protein
VNCETLHEIRAVCLASATKLQIAQVELSDAAALQPNTTPADHTYERGGTIPWQEPPLGEAVRETKGARCADVVQCRIEQAADKS